MFVTILPAIACASKKPEDGGNSGGHGKRTSSSSRHFRTPHQPYSIADFFSPAPMQWRAFPNYQVFDFDGLLGRLLSSSYIPARGTDGYDAMYDDLLHLFDKHQQNGTITIHYEARVYTARMS